MSDNEYGFIIERRFPDSDFVEVKKVLANINTMIDSDDTILPGTNYIYRIIACIPPNPSEAWIEWLDEDCSADTTYTYRIYAYNLKGKSSYSEEVEVITRKLPQRKPEAPAKLSTEALGAYRAKLMWEDTSHNETGFLIQRKKTKGPWSLVHAAPVNSIGWIDKGL